jgi:phospholipid/cholesterol/gamma-HCH transport system ATP-binding protein
MNSTIIHISDLHKSYDGMTVLRGVDLDIHMGETIAILGGSGTGKSVLLRLITGLEKPDQGAIVVEDRDIVPLKEHELVPMRRKIGMLFQSGALFDSLTAGENVAYPIREHRVLPERDIHEVVREKLRLVGLEGVEDKMPAELSGGMKKRVALARAIAIDPEIIFYDEPTSGLDPANTRRINHLICQLQELLRVTSVVVTHDLTSAYDVTNRLALLSDGRIAMTGTKDEFRQSEQEEVRRFISGELMEADDISRGGE